MPVGVAKVGRSVGGPRGHLGHRSLCSGSGQEVPGLGPLRWVAKVALHLGLGGRWEGRPSLL